MRRFYENVSTFTYLRVTLEKIQSGKQTTRVLPVDTSLFHPFLLYGIIQI